MTEDAAPLALYTDPEGADVSPAAELLRRHGFEVRVEHAHSPDELVELARRLAPAALLVTYARVGEAVLAAAPSVRIVACCSVGFDHVDLEAARRHGVWVTNVPDAATEEVAVTAFAMALSLVRHLPFLDRHVRKGGWDYQATGWPLRPSDATLGIVGMGRIGRRLATIAGSVFGEVIGCDPLVGSDAWPAGVRRVALGECLRSSRVLSLHAPLSAETARLIDADAIELMPHGAYLVNVSRGGLVDERALIDALDRGRLAGAALDVTDPEPPASDSPLRSHPRVLLTPHTAWISRRADEAYLMRQAENVVALWRERRPLTPVAEPQGGAR
ncbi:MAG TPA: C-terminal binding protein [Solirubrobacteraceae bacterium]|nr:C-terminal binding protein [Solirubrobacteraceae bacterium]